MGKVVEALDGAPPFIAGRHVIERAGQSAALTRASNKDDAMFVVGEAEGEYTLRSGLLGNTQVQRENRAANFDASTIKRFEARSERIVYEQLLGESVLESTRGATLKQAPQEHALSFFTVPPEVDGKKAPIVRLLEHARFKRTDIGLCLLETEFVPATLTQKARVLVKAKLALTAATFHPMEQRFTGRRGGHMEDVHGRQNLGRHLLERCGLEPDPHEEATSRRRRGAPPDPALKLREMAIHKRHLKAPGAATGAAKLASSAGAQSGGWADTDLSLKAMLEGVWNEARRLHSGGRAHGLQGAITHLENVCHAEVPQNPEQLEVVLRDYQRQSVQFCLDQEALEGGIESHLYAEVPGRFGAPGEPATKRLWYAPTLKTFSKTAPATPRGGILAEEMGLGKTIISLAVVLLNPASALTSPLLWDPPAGSLNGQGAIKTRATLVVCPVSLVSQWYDEAIDKTKDGTLKVYQYYGGKRTTNPAMLRDNDIVITTYQVLVSDMNARSGFAKAKIAKKGRANYVPPLAKLGFWRIILDESRVIKEANTAMAKAVRMLSAHRRWCVSGTPAPLSLENLQSQFKFLGAESIATDMGRFKHFLGQRPQAFAFFRRVQIRHSKEQRLIRHDLGGGTKSLAAADVGGRRRGAVDGAFTGTPRDDGRVFVGGRACDRGPLRLGGLPGRLGGALELPAVATGQGPRPRTGRCLRQGADAVPPNLNWRRGWRGRLSRGTRRVL